MAEHPPKKPKKVNARKTVRKKPAHILIVEDEPAHSELIRRGLLSSKNPCRLSVAATLEKAREILAADQPDLMILDWLLPDGNGEGLLPENMGDICFPVIVMTSYGDEALAVEILKAGAADYIVKSDAAFRNLPKIAQRTIRKWEIVKERKVAEKTLRESEERYRGVFENTGTATVIIEEDTTISFANDEFCRLSGCRKEEIEGRKQWTEFVVPEDLDQMLTLHRLRREQRKEVIRHYEFRFITKANQIRDIYLTIDIIHGTKQSVASLLDITERKAAEKLLRESEKKFHDTLLNLDEAFYSCTPEGFLLEHNPAFNRILGVDPGKDLRGTHLPDLWQREHDRQRYLNELMNSGFVRNFLIDVKRHGGEKIVVMANSHLIRDEKNMPVRIDGTFLDLTDRKRAEDALIRSESLLNQTQKITKVGGWEYDVATGKIEWTSEVYRIYEEPADYDPNNLQQAVEFYAPEDRAIIENAFLRAVENGEPYDLELRFVGAKGTPKWVRTTAQVERTSGKIIRVFGNIIDITDRKVAAEEVFHMAQEWQRTFDATNDAIWILSKDQKVLRSNRAAERFFQCSCGELTGKNCWEIVHCPEPPIPECPFLRAKNSLARETMELQIDGDWLDVTVDPILDAAGEFAGAVHIISDITKRKRSEEALRVVQEKYTKAFLAAPDAITISELDSGRFVEVNEAAIAVFGYSREELIGKSALELDIWQKKEDRDAFVDKVRKHGRVFQYEVIQRRKSGELFNALVNTDTLSIRGLNYLIAIIRDVTEQKLAEDALRKSEEKFRSMVDASPDMIWEIDGQGNFTYISSRCSVQLGYAPEDLIGKPIFSLIQPESVPAITTRFFEHVQDKSSFTTIEVPANRRNGSPCIIEIRSVPITGNEGQLTGFRGIARDITDRRQAEEAVRDSQKRLGDIFSFLPDAVLAIDNEGRVIAWNKAIEEMTGVAAADMLGKGNYEYSIPFYGVRRPILIDLILTGDTGIERKYLFVHHDGEKIVSEVFIPEMNEGRGAHLWFIASPLYNTAGKRVGAIETIRDITERKQVEQALQESEERYRSVVEDQTEFICRFTPDGRITFVNNAYCRYFSLDKSLCITKLHSVIVSAEDARRIKRHLASLTLENPVATIEHRVIMPSGEIRWQRWSDRAIFDKEGLLVEYQSVGRDTTEKKRAEEALRDSEMHYRSVIDNAAEGIVVVQDGIVQYANTRAREIVDLSPEEIGNQQFTGFIHPEDRALVFDRYQRRILGENVLQNYDFRIVGKSGQITWVQESAVQISWNNQPATLNFLTDITDRKLMEAEIRSLNQVLEQRVADRTGQLNAMLTEKELLLREIHHRVKNNLQIIVSLFNLQSHYISDQKVLDVIRESQNRVRAMALVHERIYRSENVGSVDLKEYLTFLGEQVFHYHGVKPSQIKLRLTMPEIRLDVDTVIPLGLVVNELLSNSLKHAFPDGRKGTISILSSTCNEDIFLSFSDDGVGFPAGLDWTNSPSLGLRLVISLVRQLHGKIELDPLPGTTFRITATRLQPLTR